MTDTTPQPDYRFDTARIHSGYDPHEHGESTTTPIYQSAAFDLRSPEWADKLIGYEEFGPVYTRTGNPTVTVLEQRLAALDGGSAAIGFASGSAAVFSTLLLLAEGGGNIVAAPTLYGAIQAGLIHFLPKFGVDTRFADSITDPADYEVLIDDQTKAIYVESISNPTIQIADLEAIAAVAHRYGIPVVVDNTVATPYLFRPFEHGADIIVYSLTKGISGHGNVIAGAVVESGHFDYAPQRFPQLHEKWWKDRDRNGHPRAAVEIIPEAPITTALRIYYLLFLGAELSPFDAYLVLRGLGTLSERLQKQVTTAHTLAEYLRGNPHVEWVRYAADEPDRSLAERYFPRGVGGLLSFGFKGTQPQEYAFLNGLQLFLYEANLGDIRSLIVNSPRITHVELEDDYRQLAGISDNLVRISAGLEDPQDLIDDLDRGFRAAFGD